MYDEAQHNTMILDFNLNAFGLCYHTTDNRSCLLSCEDALKCVYSLTFGAHGCWVSHRFSFAGGAKREQKVMRMNSYILYPIAPYQREKRTQATMKLPFLLVLASVLSLGIADPVKLATMDRSLSKSIIQSYEKHVVLFNLCF
jgi:hypothetical protein